MRNWSARWVWLARIEREGITSQARACQLYRDLYLQSMGTREISVVEGNMSVSVLVASPPPNKETEIGAGTRAEVAAALEPRLGRSVNRAEPANPLTETARKLGRYSSLLEAMIGVYSQQVQKAISSKDPNALQKLGIKPSDIPRFIREWHSLQELTGNLAAPDAAHPVLETSFRVRQAERKGGSVLRAHLEDSLELVSILQTLADAEEASREVAGGAAIGRRALDAVENEPADDSAPNSSSSKVSSA